MTMHSLGQQIFAASASAHLQATQGRNRGVSGCEPRFQATEDARIVSAWVTEEHRGPLGSADKLELVQRRQTKLAGSSSASWDIWLGGWGCPPGEGPTERQKWENGRP